MTRALFAGTADYSYQSLEDIVTDLKEWATNLKNACEILESDLRQLRENGYWKTVDYDVQAIFDEAIQFYRMSIKEITEILDGIQVEVENHHVTRTERLAQTASKLNRDFGLIWHAEPWESKKEGQYGQPNFSILERMYRIGRDATVDMVDLGNLAERLGDCI